LEHIIQISVDRLGICETCGAWFTINELTPDEPTLHRYVGQLACCRCENIFTEQSFGMNCIGVGDVYKKVRWVGPRGRWVNERPTRSFNLGLWEVIPGIMGSSSPKIRRQDRRYVVWCQKWSVKDTFGNMGPYGYFLYRMQEHLNGFKKGTKDQTDKMFFEIYPDGVPYRCRILEKRFNQMRTKGKHCFVNPSPELFDVEQFEENVIPFIVVEGMK